MPIYRTEKKNNFTIIDNRFLRSMELSLKAKGLLAMMLSLPEEWVYSIRGLAAICKENANTVRSTLNELETLGYLTREKRHDDNGRFDHIYYIHEQSVFTEAKKPHVEEPHMEQPPMEQPCMVNAALINKEESRKEKLNTEGSTTDQSNLSEGEEEPPLAALSFDGDENDYAMEWMDRVVTPTAESSFCKTWASPHAGKSAEDYRRMISANTEYRVYAEDPNFDCRRMEELIEIAADAAASTRPAQVIGGESVPTEEVRRRMLQLKGSHMEYVMECYRNTTTPVRNPKKYLLAALYNAPTTIDAYYEARIRSLGW